MKIAVDAMGGDHGPAPVIEGAMQAAQELGVGCLLVGKEQIAERPPAGGCHMPDSRITIRHAAQVVEMHESPAPVAGKNETHRFGSPRKLVKSGEADASSEPWQYRREHGRVLFLAGI